MRNGTLTIEQAVNIVELLGIDVAQGMANVSQGDLVKYGGFTLGQVEAILNRFLAEVPSDYREEVLASIMHDEKKITVTIEDVKRLLINKHGRRAIHGISGEAKTRDPNLNFFFRSLSDIDFSEIVTRRHEKFGFGPCMESKKFVKCINYLKDKIATNPQVSNLLAPAAAPCYPIILPQNTGYDDYGQMLEDLLLPAVEDSYHEAFRGKRFINAYRNKIVKQVNIVDERHAKLFADLANGPIVGILFPAVMQGFNVYAQRQMVTEMPDDFSLQGPLDAAVALVLYPKYLAHEGHVPLMDCSAVELFHGIRSPYFASRAGCGLEFSIREDLGYAAGEFSGGLFMRMD